ncbi:MAG: hypothetical protein ACJ8AO_06880 [Gemmatimonadaceae bacterium]
MRVSQFAREPLDVVPAHEPARSSSLAPQPAREQESVRGLVWQFHQERRVNEGNHCTG